MWYLQIWVINSNFELGNLTTRWPYTIPPPQISICWHTIQAYCQSSSISFKIEFEYVVIYISIRHENVLLGIGFQKMYSRRVIHKNVVENNAYISAGDPYIGGVTDKSPWWEETKKENFKPIRCQVSIFHVPIHSISNQFGDSHYWNCIYLCVQLFCLAAFSNFIIFLLYLLIIIS